MVKPIDSTGGFGIEKIVIDKKINNKKLYNELCALSKARLGESKPIELSCYIDPSTPEVLYGDQIRVKQVILNILTNAIKYTNEGFIKFRIDSIVNNDICRLVVSVEDSGIGIKKENINKLFSKFERLEATNSTIEGTGLGLAITKRLVEMMHGKIIVQSIYQKGSKFTIILDQKIIATKAKENANQVIDQDKIYPNKKILIVDDNKLNLKVAERLLRDYQVITETCESGYDCLDKIASGNIYDLILMDDMMPKMSGVETLHRLKENPDFKIPVVALTANAISGMKEKYLADGFDEYLPKPIEKPELKEILAKFLD